MSEAPISPPAMVTADYAVQKSAAVSDDSPPLVPHQEPAPHPNVQPALVSNERSGPPLAHSQPQAATSTPPVAAQPTGAMAVGAVTTTTANTEATLLVVDPLSKKLRIPMSAVIHTDGLSRNGTPSLCLLHLDGRCRHAWQCHQVHADPTVVFAERARAKATPSCCHMHGDVHAVAYLHPPVLGAHVSLDSLLIPVSALAWTSSLEKLLPSLKPGHATPIQVHQICRMHGSNRCRFAEDCHFLHICRDITKAHLGRLVPDLVTSLELRHAERHNNQSYGAGTAVAVAAATGPPHNYRAEALYPQPQPRAAAPAAPFVQGYVPHHHPHHHHHHHQPSPQPVNPAGPTMIALPHQQPPYQPAQAQQAVHQQQHVPTTVLQTGGHPVTAPAPPLVIQQVAPPGVPYPNVAVAAGSQGMAPPYYMMPGPAQGAPQPVPPSQQHQVPLHPQHLEHGAHHQHRDN